MNPKLPAPYALQKYIVEYANKKAYSDYNYDGPLNTEEEIDEAMVDMREKIGYDAQQDIMEGEWQTNIEPEFSRHCETESVAVKDNYGNYIGFTRYFGGGKHFEESSWYDQSIADSYYLTCQEKKVFAVQRTWAKFEK